MPRESLRRATAGAVLAGSAFEALRGISARERQTYTAINNLPDALAPFVWVPMQFGSLTSPLAIGSVAYVTTRRSDPAVSIIAAGVTAWIAAKVVKKVVGRGRPFDSDPHTSLRLGTDTIGSLGFVSGHAAVAMAVASVLSRHTSPTLGTAFYGLACLAGVSRVYVGAHWPIDVIGGLALGILADEITLQAVVELSHIPRSGMSDS